MSAIPIETTSKKLADFPIVKQGPNLNQEQIKKFQALAFDENSFHFWVEKRCKFRPEIALHFIKGDEMVDVLFSFSCNMWLFVPGSDKKVEDFDPNRKELLELGRSLSLGTYTSDVQVFGFFVRATIKDCPYRIVRKGNPLWLPNNPKT